MSGFAKLLTSMAVLAVLTASVLRSQTASSLFTDVGPSDPDNQPAPGINAEYPVNVDRATLATAPFQIEIELPGYGFATANLERFETFEGFDENHDPLPDTAPTDLNFIWAGRSEDFDVVISTFSVCTAASIVGVGGNYTLMLAKGATTPGLMEGMTHDHVLQEIGKPPITVGSPSEHAAPATRPQPFPASRRSTRRAPIVGPAALVPEKTHRPEPAIIVGLLAVFTEAARVGIGGDPTESTDDTHIKCLIRQSTAETNQGMINSNITARILLVASEYLPNFEPTGSPRATIDAVRLNSTIRELRNQAGEAEGDGADVVGAFLGSWTSFDACGRAIVQRKGCGDDGPLETCDTGFAYNDYAYFFAAFDCALRFKTVAHELGHVLGSEHQFSGVIEREHSHFYFSFAFAFPPESPQYQTLTVSGFDYAPVLNYSNPNVLYDGWATGSPGEANNALTLEKSSPIVGIFRPPFPALIFKDDFETGDLVSWSVPVDP